MDLKIKDVVDLLNVSESTIRRWLAEGKIPAYRINNQFRFSREEIEDWVLKRKTDKNNGNMFSTEQEMDSSPHLAGSKQFNLFRSIYKGHVLSNIAGSSKEEVIRNTMKALAKELNLDPDVLTEMLLDRERLHPTALNHGIGIPHTRDFLLSSPYDIVLVVYPQKPLPYGALDGKPVHTMFFLFASDDKRHLNLLAKIAHLSNMPQAREFLQTKPNKESLLEYIKNWESSIQGPDSE